MSVNYNIVFVCLYCLNHVFKNDCSQSSRYFSNYVSLVVSCPEDYGRVIVDYSWKLFNHMNLEKGFNLSLFKIHFLPYIYFNFSTKGEICQLNSLTLYVQMPDVSKPFIQTKSSLSYTQSKLCVPDSSAHTENLKITFTRFHLKGKWCTPKLEMTLQRSRRLSIITVKPSRPVIPKVTNRVNKTPQIYQPNEPGKTKTAYPIQTTTKYLDTIINLTKDDEGSISGTGLYEVVTRLVANYTPLFDENTTQTVQVNSFSNGLSQTKVDSTSRISHTSVSLQNDQAETTEIGNSQKSYPKSTPTASSIVLQTNTSITKETSLKTTNHLTVTPSSSTTKKEPVSTRYSTQNGTLSTIRSQPVDIQSTALTKNNITTILPERNHSLNSSEELKSSSTTLTRLAENGDTSSHSTKQTKSQQTTTDTSTPSTQTSNTFTTGRTLSDTTTEKISSPTAYRNFETKTKLTDNSSPRSTIIVTIQDLSEETSTQIHQTLRTSNFLNETSTKKFNNHTIDNITTTSERPLVITSSQTSRIISTTTYVTPNTPTQSSELLSTDSTSHEINKNHTIDDETTTSEQPLVVTSSQKSTVILTTTDFTSNTPTQYNESLRTNSTTNEIIKNHTIDNITTTSERPLMTTSSQTSTIISTTTYVTSNTPTQYNDSLRTNSTSNGIINKSHTIDNITTTSEQPLMTTSSQTSTIISTITDYTSKTPTQSSEPLRADSTSREINKKHTIDNITKTSEQPSEATSSQKPTIILTTTDYTSKPPTRSSKSLSTGSTLHEITKDQTVGHTIKTSKGSLEVSSTQQSTITQATQDVTNQTSHHNRQVQNTAPSSSEATTTTVAIHTTYSTLDTSSKSSSVSVIPPQNVKNNHNHGSSLTSQKIVMSTQSSTQKLSDTSSTNQQTDHKITEITTLADTVEISTTPTCTDCCYACTRVNVE
ncbi:hypothetical protein RF11_01757 [Thelohanellus kitauei]|uniref:Uncharacterized protein n=1 Tax=Thelohanellus kitauei TaxID=669202 RepID=A0A0C2MKH7_THEKT|nr:hypothetical protein RF11_01757 [Thelohanellus kitauei]